MSCADSGKFGRRIFHVDMDAFYASVEQRENPELAGKPVVIGAAPGQRGVVSACSYEARHYGVRSAMPVSIAKRLCPQAVFLPVRMNVYQQASVEVMKIFDSFTPVVHQISIDEAFLDMTGTDKLFGTMTQTALAIKKAVKDATSLTISVGGGSGSFIAKLASDYSKPDGLWIVEEGCEMEFMDRLELKDIWGLGKKTLERLNDLNIKTVEELRSFSESSLSGIFGKAGGSFLYNACRGIGPETISAEAASRSISNETTFEQDVRDRETIERLLLELSHHVMFRMMQDGSKSRTVCIKLRFTDFTTTTVQKTLSRYVTSAEEIYAVSLELLNRRWNGQIPLRLVGTGLCNLEAGDSPEQHELFEDVFDRRHKVEKTVLNLRSRGGKITKASLMKPQDKKNLKGD